eukprot:GHVU01181582.1.p1 GENE.GHVU01181582.1~~GHVU01181582.1.p1  ORF type:complete len:417 (+),score=97.47 GHVU01181582.1:343-1593(+)
MASSDSSNAKLHKLSAANHLTVLEEYPSALKLLNEIPEAERTPDARTSKAVVQYHLGSYADSIKDITHAIGTEPEGYRYRILGNGMLRLGAYRYAARAYRDALSMSVSPACRELCEVGLAKANMHDTATPKESEEVLGREHTLACYRYPARPGTAAAAASASAASASSSSQHRPAASSSSSSAPQYPDVSSTTGGGAVVANSKSSNSAPKKAEAAAASTGGKPAIKWESFHTEDRVEIHVYIGGLKVMDVQHDVKPRTLGVAIHKIGGDQTRTFSVEIGPLFADLNPNSVSVKCGERKVELSVAKAKKGAWPSLESKPDAATVYPTSKPKVDWNSVDKHCDEELKDYPEEGDAAVNTFFRHIYANATDEARQAMNKSFQTSGGTVLSTDWNEVQKTDYERRADAPQGQVMKKWRDL